MCKVTFTFKFSKNARAEPNRQNQTFVRKVVEKGINLVRRTVARESLELRASTL